LRVILNDNQNSLSSVYFNVMLTKVLSKRLLTICFVCASSAWFALLQHNLL